MRDSFASTLTKNILNNDKIILIIGDTGSGLFDEIKKKRPNQFINAGIAEANMVTVAAGIASSGYNVFVYAIGPHVVYRAYEQIRNDVCLNNSNVKIVSIGSGLHYADHGPTHHSTEDFGVLKVLPSMKIFSPCGDEEVRQITNYLTKLNGPSYLRLGRGIDKNFNIKFNPHKSQKITEGKDLTIFTTGCGVNDCYEVTKRFYKNKSIELVNISSIKPIDKSTIIKSSKKTKKILILEEHQKIGGLADEIFKIIQQNNIKCKNISLGIEDVFCSYSGSYEGIKKKFKISQQDIKKAIDKII